MKASPCVIGLDAPQVAELRAAYGRPFVAHPTVPKVFVQNGRLFVESATSFELREVSAVVYHGIFEDDHDLIAALALWGGPCLPNAAAMMDCRLKLPCLVRALRHTQYATRPRGYVSAGLSFPVVELSVAKWGNWHCGENKRRLVSGEDACVDHNAIVEPFFDGTAVRVAVIGDEAFQIRLDGDDWLKSIHHERAEFMTPDANLVDDTKRVARGIGLEVAANDYIVGDDQQATLLEVNHIPNVTRFAQMWDCYREFVVEWLDSVTDL